MSGAVQIAVHGGAGRVPAADSDPEWCALAEAGLRDALERGGDALADGADAVEAVVAAVRVLEACEAFNAGRGCVLDADGDVCLDASVMNGADAGAGGVVGVSRVAHPVEAAREVLREGRHVVLAGAGAERFAAECGLELVAPEHHITNRRRAHWERARAAAASKSGGTVGAVACDADGHLAAATSTGGMVASRPGRIADSALPGSGTWADDATCAVSATGTGEFFIRTAFARAVDARMRFAGEDLAIACGESLTEVANLGGSGGCIAVDARGASAFPFDTPDMPRGLRVGDGPSRIVLHGR